MSGQLIKILISVGACLGLFVAVLTMALKVQRERAVNLALGVGFLLLFAGGIGYAVLRPTIAAESEAPQRYVAYFENAGGVEPGDIVRIKGRRAGKVVSTQVVRRDDRVMIRVEFDIAPGSGSQWLKDGGLPADSVIRVRTPAFLGRPTLSIEIGESAEVIPVGGEWRRVHSAPSDDQFNQWLAKLREFDQAIDRYLGYVRPEQIAEIKVQVARIRAMLDRVRDSVLNAAEQAPAMAARIGELDRTVKAMLAATRDSSAAATRQVASMHDALAAAPDNVSRAAQTISELGQWVVRANAGLSRLRDTTAREEATRTLLAARRMSAQLRAGAARGEYDPRNAGDMPPWRISKKHFNGDASPLEAAQRAEGNSGSSQSKAAPVPRGVRPGRE